MQNLFLSFNKEKIYNNLIKYFNELNQTAKKLDIEIDFIVTHPYWVYSKDKNNKLVLENKLNNKVTKLICDSFQEKKNINQILITKLPEFLNIEDLTFDKRHLKSEKIKLLPRDEICNL